MVIIGGNVDGSSVVVLSVVAGIVVAVVVVVVVAGVVVDVVVLVISLVASVVGNFEERSDSNVSEITEVSGYVREDVEHILLKSSSDSDHTMLPP